MMDYASFLLEAKKHLKLYEEAVIKREFDTAFEHALNTSAEVRLLAQIAKELWNEKKT